VLEFARWQLGKRYLLAIRPKEEGHTNPVVFVSQTSTSSLLAWASVRDGAVDLSELSITVPCLGGLGRAQFSFRIL
jgi:hypothetical protein